MEELQRTPPERGAEQAASLWQQFRAHRDMAVREQLVERYMRFARIMAAKVYAGRSFGGVEFEDYLQFAHVGLLESIDRFDPERGVKFESFASARISGAILNGIETASDVHGQVSARRRLLAARVDSLRGAPEEADGERAESPEQVFATLAEVAIGLAVGFALDDSGMYRTEGASYADTGYAALEMKQIRERALALLVLLPGNLRLVIEYHYLQQIAFDQIALRLGLSKGRIAQIHKEALGNLRASFKASGVLSLSC